MASFFYPPGTNRSFVVDVSVDPSGNDTPGQFELPDWESQLHHRHADVEVGPAPPRRTFLQCVRGTVLPSGTSRCWPGTYGWTFIGISIAVIISCVVVGSIAYATRNQYNF
ncbi:hypothetical protein M501DRAFT_989042 [Patellaria atrata CBS 101060]|uniref:Uncharacterized protein n=1 Tax=Patellaria atrata CBS 101060 TaxID=1346257 RepID=A0A9P4S2X2_9PEZI|nr:hypothetical protein M501DRAFT_989042 [Patellaria atrata CBS 101060]